MESLFYVLPTSHPDTFFYVDTVWSKYQFLNTIWTLSMQGGELPSSGLLLLKMTGIYVDTHMAAGTLAF